MNTDFHASAAVELAGADSDADARPTEVNQVAAGLRAHIIFDRLLHVIACDEDARRMASMPWSGLTMVDRCLRVQPGGAADLVASVASGARTLAAAGAIIPLRSRSLDARLVSLIRGGSSPLGPLYLLTIAQRFRITNFVALARRLGLSMAEAGIVEALCSGKRVAEYAHQRRVQTCTVRTQLKSIYRKLDVHSQVELVSRMQRAAEGER